MNPIDYVITITFLALLFFVGLKWLIAREHLAKERLKVRALTPEESREVQVNPDRNGNWRVFIMRPCGVKADFMSCSTFDEPQDALLLAQDVECKKHPIRVAGMAITSANMPKGAE